MWDWLNRDSILLLGLPLWPNPCTCAMVGHESSLRIRGAVGQVITSSLWTSALRPFCGWTLHSHPAKHSTKQGVGFHEDVIVRPALRQINGKSLARDGPQSILGEIETLLLDSKREDLGLLFLDLGLVNPFFRVGSLKMGLESRIGLPTKGKSLL